MHRGGERRRDTEGERDRGKAVHTGTKMHIHRDSHKCTLRETHSGERDNTHIQGER